MPISRPYDPERDRDHVLRIWREVGWIEKDAHATAFDVHASQGGARVVDQAGEAEALVLTAPGVLRYDEVSLPASFVTAVTVSRVARRQGYATRATAEAIVEDASAGAAVSALGIFDQGFYDKLGYGTGSNELFQTIDPATLAVDGPKRSPVRLGVDDYAEVHANRLARRLVHGSCCLTHESVTHSEMLWTDGPFGIGFRDDGGTLTHHVWFRAEKEHGPWRIEWFAFRTLDEFMELLGLLRSLSDQVHSMRIPQLPGIQLQDLIHRPFRGVSLRRGGAHRSDDRYAASWQMRICDLERCIQAVSMPGPAVEFDLVLSDPLADLIDGAGVGGRWTVRFGEESTVERGCRGGLPVLEASVGAFTRLWLCVLPATSLAVTDRLSGPASLLHSLDRLLRLPAPCSDWPF